MPQIALETFVTQYFWMLIILGFFYYFVANTVLPQIALIYKTRKTLEDSSITSDKDSSDSSVSTKLSTLIDSPLNLMRSILK